LGDFKASAIGIARSLALDSGKIFISYQLRTSENASRPKAGGKASFELPTALHKKKSFFPAHIRFVAERQGLFDFRILGRADYLRAHYFSLLLQDFLQFSVVVFSLFPAVAAFSQFSSEFLHSPLDEPPVA
jgi:hypothetical protein